MVSIGISEPNIHLALMGIVVGDMLVVDHRELVDGLEDLAVNSYFRNYIPVKTSKKTNS